MTHDGGQIGDSFTHGERIMLLLEIEREAANGNTAAMLILDEIDSILFSDDRWPVKALESVIR